MIGFVVTLCVCFTLGPNVARAADVPAFCDTTREVRLYVLGVRKGRSLAASAIAAATDPIDVCTDLDAIDDLRALIAEIVDEVVIPVGASEATQCHVLGQIAGLLAAIGDLQDDCTGLCIADGEFIGEISAQLYCALSIALDGLVPVEFFVRLATDTCGNLFQVSCDNAFESTAVDDLACLPFTEDTFTEIFREVQNNQCADNPDDT